MQHFMRSIGCERRSALEGLTEQGKAKLARELERPLAKIKTLIEENEAKEMEYLNKLVRRIEYVLL